MSSEVQATTDGTSCQDRASEPEGVAVTSNNGSPRRVSSLDDVDGTGCRDDADTETENESTALKLAIAVGVVDSGRVDDAPNDDQPCTNLHSDLTAPGIDGRSDEG